MVAVSVSMESKMCRHGVLLMGALYSAMFMILVGVVLQANETTVGF